MVWIEFSLCSVLLIFFAYNLCKEGVILSSKTKVEEGIIGMFLLAIATSFPEIATASAAVFSYGRIGLGYGDIVGSVVINLMILFYLDIVHPGGRIMLRISRLNRVTAAFGAIASAILIITALLRVSWVSGFSLGRTGGESLLILGAYFVYLYFVKNSGKEEDPDHFPYRDESFLSVWSKFILLLLVVMLLGIWMAKIGDRVVETTNLSQTFIGTLFLGLITSFPEIIVSITALKAGSVDMAVGNILGSNLFDVCIVSFLDLLSSRPILGVLTGGQILATFTVFVMTSLTFAVISIKKDTCRRIKWDTGIIFSIGFIGFVLLYYIK